MKRFSDIELNKLNNFELFFVELKNGKKKYAVKVNEEVYSNALYAEYPLGNKSPIQYLIPIEEILMYSRLPVKDD